MAFCCLTQKNVSSPAECYFKNAEKEIISGSHDAKKSKVAYDLETSVHWTCSWKTNNLYLPSSIFSTVKQSDVILGKLHNQWNTKVETWSDFVIVHLTATALYS